MAGNFADLTAVLTLDSARFSEEAARVKKELGETSALADLMSGKVSQSFRKQADAAEQSLSRQALAAQKPGYQSDSIRLPCAHCPHSSRILSLSLPVVRIPSLSCCSRGADQRFIRWTAQPAYPAEGGTSRDQGCL